VAARACSRSGAPDSPISEAVLLEVLIPRFERSAEFAVILSGLAAQLEQDHDIILSDQPGSAIWEDSSGVRRLGCCVHKEGLYVAKEHCPAVDW
jgi:hypothetical protein